MCQVIDNIPRLLEACHNSVAFTLTRYGGLFENGSETAADWLDLLLGGSSKVSGNVLHLATRKLR
jgi:hypothetical protein